MNVCCAALCLVSLSCLTLCDPMDCSLPRSSVIRGFSRQENWSGWPCPPLGTRIEPRSLTLQADSLPSKRKGKPKNIGVGSLSLFQGIYLTEEITPMSSELQADSWPAELPGKLLWTCMKKPLEFTENSELLAVASETTRFFFTFKVSVLWGDEGHQMTIWIVQS